ncbi:MAG: dihydropteroate synthase [Orrella sp.]
MTATTWQCGRFEFALDRPVLMGVVNVTPDSFSDGGKHDAAEAAIKHARQLIKQGARAIDIGGESTRPGAEPVTAKRELDRIMPVLESLRHANVALSVDTCKPEVMRIALDAGADIINDVTGFTDPEAQSVVAAHGRCGLCVMHMRGEPRTMQQAPTYENVTKEVFGWLDAQARHLVSLGISPNRMTLDPGFGFGKTIEHNYELLRHLDQLVALGYPVLIGLSRKSMIGAVTGRPVDQRIAGSLSGALAGVYRGARVVRVHDVEATKDAIEVWQAVAFGPKEAP